MINMKPADWRPWSTRRQLEHQAQMLHQLIEQGDRQFAHMDRHLRQLVEQGLKLDRILTKMSQMDDEITQLTSDVTAMRGAVDSATALISGFQAAMAKAVADALAAGATPAQLQSLTDLDTSLNAEKTDLAAAVAANPAPAPAP